MVSLVTSNEVVLRKKSQKCLSQSDAGVAMLDFESI
jgi:hypothetical protein